MQYSECIMSLELDCPVDGCTGVCTGESESEVMEQAEAHVNDAHPDLELDEETVEGLKASIESV
ncbi:DUF1059 domain-containing protein [Haloarculaceae archaeon H-GB2-1]|nr:DUF1059 domain-containing protein [Haloarculaceae archaeon H-GB1-1]MEA5385705.1 DUF1059 domain-containing protein [Haloarculaceae archaeon H-GB11]MEA5407206.1 DUF1059 domain-containing protein [Haloarculaceae archaeon H-GB2-1]